MSTSARGASPPAEDPGSPSPVTPPPRKASVRLQERRGSNLSLLLDVSSMGAEPVCSVSTPKEVWLQLLHTSSRPLTHALLQQAAADPSALNAEYQRIPSNFVSSAELDVPGHAVKDRYRSILPNPESRVILRNLEVEGAGPERYINANYVRGFGGAPHAYIATQGPMLHTVTDFWEMVWQERSSIIVMVTRLKENNEKCELYWPQSKRSQRGSEEEEQREEEQQGEERQGEEGAADAEEDTCQFGSFTLRVKNVEHRNGFSITELEVQLLAERRTVRHFWFTSWPDHHIPQCITSLLSLVEEVETYGRSLAPPTSSQPTDAPGDGLGPIVVHCSAGIGRTGCFIASSIGCRQLRESAQVDVLETVCQLRLDRGGMIQTPEQYQFLYSALAQYSSWLQLRQCQSQDQSQDQDQSQSHPQDQHQHQDQDQFNVQTLSQQDQQSPEGRLSVQLQNLQLVPSRTDPDP